jgi:WD40 repeat protein
MKAGKLILILVIALVCQKVTGQDKEKEDPPPDGFKKKVVLKGEFPIVVGPLAFSPDGKYLAASSEGTVKLWDVGSRKLLATFKGHDELHPLRGLKLDRVLLRDPIQAIAFSPDGKGLVSATGHSLILWQVPSGKTKASIKGDFGQVRSLKFNPDGKKVALLGYVWELRMWEPSKNKLHSVLTLVSPANPPREPPKGKEEPKVVPGPLPPSIEEVKFFDGGKTLAVAYHPRFKAQKEPNMEIWDVGAQKVVGKMSAYHVTQIAFSQDGKKLAAGSLNEFVYLWDVSTGKELAKWKQPGQTGGVAFSSDGKTLKVGISLRDQRLPQFRFLKTESGKEILLWKGYMGPFSPDGRTLATITGRIPIDITLWDVSTKIWEPVPGAKQKQP